MFKTLLLVFFLVLTGVINAQKLTLQLTDEKNQPVPYAMVAGINPPYEAISDLQGVVQLLHAGASDSVKISGISIEDSMVFLGNAQFENGWARIILQSKASMPLHEVTLVTNTRNTINNINDLRLNLRALRGTQDLLRQVPGLFIAQHAGGGKAEQMFLRGFDIDHGTDVLLEVDGVPVNMVSHAHGQGYADLHFVIPELVERITYGKGSYDADKGNFATAGHVSFSTKKKLAGNFVKAEGGQFGYYRTVGGFNIINANEHAGANLYIAGSLQGFDGYFEASQKLRRRHGLLRYNQPIARNSNLSLTASVFNSSWLASGQIPERAVNDGSIGFFGAIDPTEGGNTLRNQVNLQWQSFLPGRWQFTQQVYAVDYRFRLYSNFTFFKIDSLNGDQIRQGEQRLLAGMHSSFKKESRIGNVLSLSQFGLQYRTDDVRGLELSRTRNRQHVLESLASGRVQERNLGAYARQRITFDNSLSITTSLRYDRFSNRYKDNLGKATYILQQGILSPKLAVEFQLDPKVKLFALAGRGFHSNDTRVALQENRRLATPSFGADFGGVFQLNHMISIQPTVWYLWLDQEFIYVGDEAVIEAGGRTLRRGFDFTGQAVLSKTLSLSLDVNFSDAVSADAPRASRFVPLAPRVTSSGSLVYQANEGLGASLSYRWMGKRPAVEDNSMVAYGYFISDAAVSYAYKKLQLSITAENIFNTRWKETQFFTESRLSHEAAPVGEMHFTPGTPFFSRLAVTMNF